MNQGTHTDEEQCIVGTWVVDEARKAVEMGYGVVDMFEFWEYKVTCFDKDPSARGRFAGYVNIFLKLNQTSPG
jgi:hypothetical protein